MCWQKYCYEGTSSLNWVFLSGSAAALLPGCLSRIWCNSEEKEGHTRCSTEIDRINTFEKRCDCSFKYSWHPDSKDYHPLQQSSVQSAKMYFEMKFTTDTRTSYSTSNCKLLTDLEESLSMMQSGTWFQTPDLVLVQKNVIKLKKNCLHLKSLGTILTKEKQRQSIHWFLNRAVQRRVISSLPNDKPLAEISSVPNHIFLPSSNDCKNLDASFRFHIVNVLVKHIKCLKPFKKSVPNFIDHHYVKEFFQKS